MTAATRIVVGELDQPDFAAIGRYYYLAERMPNARLELLPGVAHLPPMDAPDDFTCLLLEHLAGSPVHHGPTRPRRHARVQP